MIGSNKKGQRLRDVTGKCKDSLARQLLHTKRDWQLWLLMLLPLAYILIFYYWPMYGVQIAFRQYSPRLGITGSEWVGLKWFEKFFTNYSFTEVLLNTLTLSLYSIVVGFPLPIMFALILNALKNDRFRRTAQTITYIPYFLSVTVLVAIINLIFSPTSGLYGSIYRMLGGNGYPYDFRSMSGAFRHIYVWSGVWQSLGWNTIIYTAALSSVSQELHDAAMIDGASRWQRIFCVDLPAILPTVIIMLILTAGSILGVGFEKAYLLQTPLNLDTSEVISTYVYKAGMGKASDFSYGTAVGLFNSIVNLAFLVVVNWTSKKASDDEVSLF